MSTPQSATRLQYLKELPDFAEFRTATHKTIYSIYKELLFSGAYTKIMSADVYVGGHASRFLNDVAIGRDGKLYISDSSWKWTREEGMKLLQESRPTGR